MRIGEVTTTTTSASVTLTPDASGTASADAVWFVKKGLGQPRVGYILTDHLGTPTKIIDNTKAVAWSRLWTPFGITVSEVSTGTFATSVAFPGQMRDAETTLAYNYFRDYDPSLGRYIQSDPIGLNGGYNTYGYVDGNPFRFADPTGLVFPYIPTLEEIEEAIDEEIEDARTVYRYFGNLYDKGCFFWDWEVAVILAANAPWGRLGKLVDRATGGKIKKKVLSWARNWGKKKKPGTGKPKGGKPGDTFPDRPLPRDEYGRPIGEKNAGKHTQIGTKQGRNEKYPQAREFDESGKPIKDIDFTNHGRPDSHTNPHQHKWQENPTGGTPKRGPAEPVDPGGG